MPALAQDAGEHDRNFGVVGGADASNLTLKKYVNNDQPLSAGYAYVGPRLGLVVGF